MNCSIARALEQIGEWWTLLILREAFMGTLRFDRFQRHLGIARNILSARLKKLVAREILERIVAPDDARRVEYRLTPKGLALFPVLTALAQWGDRWVLGAGRVPIVVVDRESSHPIAEVRVTSREGRVLGPSDVIALPGPGAAAATMARLSRARNSTAPARGSHRGRSPAKVVGLAGAADEKRVREDAR